MYFHLVHLLVTYTVSNKKFPFIAEEGILVNYRMPCLTSIQRLDSSHI